MFLEVAILMINMSLIFLLFYNMFYDMFEYGITILNPM